MTADSALVIALIAFTFAVAIVIGVYQWRKARMAHEQHKHSSVGDLRDGMPGAPSAAPRPRVPDQRDASA
jgi:hypothetical protein